MEPKQPLNGSPSKSWLDAALFVAVVLLALYGAASALGEQGAFRDLQAPSSFLAWASALLQGDWGQSFRNGAPVFSSVVSRMPLSIGWTAIAVGIALFLAALVGRCSASVSGSPFDRFVVTGCYLGRSIAPFLVAFLASGVFAIGLGWAPAMVLSWQTETLATFVRSLVLPVLVLAAVLVVQWTPQARNLCIHRGQVSFRYVFAHVLCAALTGVASIAGAALIIEAIFAIPGLGRLFWFSVRFSDPYLLQGSLLGVLVITGVTFALGRILERKLCLPGGGLTVFEGDEQRVAAVPSNGPIWQVIWMPVLWLTGVVLCAFAAPYLGLTDPDDVALERSLAEPSLSFWFGADAAGRDVFSRALHGSSSLVTCLGAGLLLGFGLCAAIRTVQRLYPRSGDSLVRLCHRIAQVCPPLLLITAAIVVWDSSYFTIALSLALFFPSFVLTVIQQDGSFRDLRRPGVFAFLAMAITTVASVSYMRLGPPSDVAGWGAAVSYGQEHFQYAPHISLGPGAILVMTTLAIIIIADRLDAMSPARKPTDR